MLSPVLQGDIEPYKTENDSDSLIDDCVHFTNPLKSYY